MSGCVKWEIEDKVVILKGFLMRLGSVGFIVIVGKRSIFFLFGNFKLIVLFYS